MAVSQTLTLKETKVDVQANTSRVQILWKSQQTGDSHNYNSRTAKYWITVNGKKTAYTVSYTLPEKATETIELFGGKVLDTPGFSSLEFNNISKYDIRDSFVEFGKFPCKFKDCVGIVKYKALNGKKKARLTKEPCSIFVTTNH